MDIVHPTNNTQLSCGWIRKGVRKEICSNTGRRRLNISGAVDLLEGKFHFQEDHMLNAEATIAFLEKVEEAYPDKKKIRNYSAIIFIEELKKYYVNIKYCLIEKIKFYKNSKSLNLSMEKNAE